MHTLYSTSNMFKPGHVCQFSGTRFSQDWQVFVVVVVGCRAVESGIVNQLAFHISVRQGSLGYCMVYQSSQWPLLKGTLPHNVTLISLSAMYVRMPLFHSLNFKCSTLGE